MSETVRISREHFGHRSGSASHTFLINSRHFVEMRRRSWAKRSLSHLVLGALICRRRTPRIG